MRFFRHFNRVTIVAIGRFIATISVFHLLDFLQKLQVKIIIGIVITSLTLFLLFLFLFVLFGFSLLLQFIDVLF